MHEAGLQYDNHESRPGHGYRGCSGSHDQEHCLPLQGPLVNTCEYVIFHRMLIVFKAGLWREK